MYGFHHGAAGHLGKDLRHKVTASFNSGLFIQYIPHGRICPAPGRIYNEADFLDGAGKTVYHQTERLQSFHTFKEKQEDCHGIGTGADTPDGFGDSGL